MHHKTPDSSNICMLKKVYFLFVVYSFFGVGKYFHNIINIGILQKA